MSFHFVVEHVAEPQKVQEVTISVIKLRCLSGGFAKVHAPADEAAKLKPGDPFTLNPKVAGRIEAKPEAADKGK